MLETSALLRMLYPSADKLLAICKERNMPNEMVTYYERMVAEFKKI